jgi:hypothetical protein
MCQTHHRQMLKEGRIKPIHPYRKRTPGTVKFAGFRLSAGCARKLRKHAKKKGISQGAAIAAVLERWVKDGAVPP